MSLLTLPDSIILFISQFSPELLSFKPTLKVFFKICPLHKKSAIPNWDPESKCPICGYCKTYKQDELKLLKKKFRERCSKILKKRKYVEVS